MKIYFKNVLGRSKRETEGNKRRLPEEVPKKERKKKKIHKERKKERKKEKRMRGEGERKKERKKEDTQKKNEVKKDRKKKKERNGESGERNLEVNWEGWMLVFYGRATIVGYVMPNHIYTLFLREESEGDIFKRAKVYFFAHS